MSEYTIEPRRAELVSYGTPVYNDAAPTVEAPQEEETQSEGVVVEPQNVEVVSPESTPPVETPEVETSDQERIFKEMFEKTFGMPPEQLKNELDATRQEKQRIEAERQLQQLQREWGVDEEGLSHRLELINKRLLELPEATRKALDNYEGINLIWNSLRAEMPQYSSPPRYERNSVAPGVASQRHMFTREQLAAMSPADYRKNNDAILYAYQNNLIG